MLPEHRLKQKKKPCTNTPSLDPSVPETCWKNQLSAPHKWTISRRYTSAILCRLRKKKYPPSTLYQKLRTVDVLIQIQIQIQESRLQTTAKEISLCLHVEQTAEMGVSVTLGDSWICGLTLFSVVNYLQASLVLLLCWSYIEIATEKKKYAISTETEELILPKFSGITAANFCTVGKCYNFS